MVLKAHDIKKCIWWSNNDCALLLRVDVRDRILGTTKLDEAIKIRTGFVLWFAMTELMEQNQW